MTLVNGIMMLGALGLAVPVIIHLLNRSRYQRVPWAAMHLIEPLVRKNSRRIRLEQILLLILRSAIPVLLAVCMAGPVLLSGGLVGCQNIEGEPKASVIVMLDSSYSMESAESSRTRYDRARAEVAEVVGRLPRGSDVMVLQTGSFIEPLTSRPSFDLPGVRTRVLESQSGSGAADFAKALEAAVPMMAELSHANRDLLLVSDFQDVTWRESKRESVARMKKVFDGLALKPSLTLMPVKGEARDNLSVESLVMSPKLVGVEQPVRWRATLRNHGKRDVELVRAALLIDGVTVDERMVDIESGQSTDLLFEHRFEKTDAGSHWVELRLEGDEIHADNSYTLAFDVLDRLPVLIVEPTASGKFREGEADFLELALEPFTQSKQKELKDLIAVEVCRPGELASRNLEKYRVVILADVPRMDEAALGRVEAFVKAGGGLLVYPGANVLEAGRQWYDEAFFRMGRGLLPAKLGTVRDAETLGEGDNVVSIAQQQYDHPSLALFNDPRNGNLATITFNRWFNLREPESDSRRDLSVIARLSTGAPFLLAKKFGEGAVIMSAAPADDSWSNGPAALVYLPLHQQLVLYLASQFQSNRNLMVGEKIEAHFSRESAGQNVHAWFYPVAHHQGESPEQVRLPDQKLVDRGENSVASFEQTFRPGLYVIQPKGADPKHYAVNVDRAESDLNYLADDQMNDLASELGAVVADNAEQYLQQGRERLFGREIWHWFLAMVLLVLFLEMTLQQWMTRHRQ